MSILSYLILTFAFKFQCLHLEKFPNTRKPSYKWVCEEFWNLRGKHNPDEKINK